MKFQDNSGLENLTSQTKCWTPGPVPGKLISANPGLNIAIKFTDEELSSRFRFSRNTIKYQGEILNGDRQRQTKRNHALSPT